MSSAPSATSSSTDHSPAMPPLVHTCAAQPALRPHIHGRMSSSEDDAQVSAADALYSQTQFSGRARYEPLNGLKYAAPIAICDETDLSIQRS